MTTMTKPEVTFVDLLRVAWHRHRVLVLATAVLVAVASVTMGVSSHETHLRGSNFLTAVYFRTVWEPFYLNLVCGVGVAVFWGAPLVSREYESRTNLVAWGQDVAASRWLTSQLALLGFFASCFSAVVWLAMRTMTDGLRAASRGAVYQPFTGWFEVAPQLQVGYTLFGFGLGVAAGTLTRRVVPAMAIALIGFTAVRIVVVEWLRGHYLPPVHTFQAWSDVYQYQVPDYAMYIASGYADANGVPIGEHDWTCAARTPDAQLDCLKANGVAGHYAEFQPLERLGLFQWIETGIFLVLAAGLLVLAWYWVKRAHRV